MKQSIVILVAFMLSVSSAMGQFTTASQANKLKPIGSLITGPTDLGIEGSTVNQFDGSVSLTVPLLPGVDLLYSSTNVPSLMNYENRDMQASDVGAGWTLDLGSVVANLHGTSSIGDDSWYYLAPNGSRTEIVKDASGVYRLQNDPYSEVELSKYVNAAGNTVVGGVTIVKEDGSQLRFGDFQAGIGPKEANRCEYYWGPTVANFSASSNNNQICYRWDLSQVVDSHGIVVSDIYYDQEQVTVNGVAYTQGSYPSYILNDRTGQKISFVLGDRNANEYQIVDSSPSHIQFYQTKYISQIQVYASSQASSPFLKFTLDTSMVFNGTKTKRLLKSITEFDANGNSLPSLDFSYDASDSYILDSVEEPAGGFVKIHGSDVSYSSALNQQGTNDTLIQAGNLTYDQDFCSSSSGETLASYSKATGQLTIEKWIGEWVSQTISVSSPLTTAGNDTVVVSDNHVALVYTGSDNTDNFLVYDWQAHSQTWNLGLSESASPNYNRLMPAISQTGTHVALYEANTSGSTGPVLDAWYWDPSTKTWEGMGALSFQTGSNSWTGTNTERVLLEMTDNMVLLVNNGGAYGYQFGVVDGTPTWNEVFSTASVSAAVEFRLTNNYIGWWDDATGALYAEVFNYAANGTASCVQETLGLNFSTGFPNNGQASYPIFTDDRVLLSVFFNNGSQPQVTIRLWKWNGSGFDALSNLPGWSGYNSDPNYVWNYDCAISKDWVFVLQNETGAAYNSSDPEAEIYGYVWDESTGEYQSAGTHIYSMLDANGVDNYRMFMNSIVALTNDFFVVNSVGRTEILSGIDHPARDGFVDVFPLDRTSPSAWSTAATRVFDSDNHSYYSDYPNETYNRADLLLGYNFVGVHSEQTGETKVKLYHGVDKSWSNSVDAYTVTETVDSSVINPDIVSNYSYGSNPTFNANLVSPGFPSSSISFAGNGSTQTLYNNSQSEPYLLGAVTETKVYDQSNSVIEQSTPSYSTYLPEWYLYQVRLATESTTRDGVTTSSEYTYNSTNGLPATKKDIVGVNTGASTFQDKETDLTYAYQNNSGMQSANMLSQVSEVQTYSVTDGVSIPSQTGNPPSTRTLISDVKTLYSSSAPYYQVSTEADSNGTGAFFTTSAIITRDSFGNITESENAEGTPTTIQYGYNGTLPIGEIAGASSSESAVATFDDGTSNGWTYYTGGQSGSASTTAHTGTYGWYMPSSTWCQLGRQFTGLNQSDIYTFSGWVLTPSFIPIVTCQVEYNGGGSDTTFTLAEASGTGSWQHLTGSVNLNNYPNVVYIIVTAENGNGSELDNCYWDDIRFGPSNALISTTGYDPNTFQQTYKTGPSGVTTYYQYDTFGRPTEALNDDGAVLSQTSYYYSRAGNGGSFSSSAPNYVQSETYPDGTSSTSMITRTYTDGLGRTIQVIKADGSNYVVSAVDYDAAGRQYLVWKPYTTSSQSYDTQHATDAENQYGFSNPYTETDYYSDPLSRVEYVKPAGWTSQNEWITYDYGSSTVNGQPLYYTDKIVTVGSNTGQTDSRVYTDNLGRTVETETFFGTTPEYSATTIYNMLGDPIQTTDPDGHTSTSEYNFLGRQIAKTTPDNGTSQYLYDNGGRLRFMLDADGDSTGDILYWKYDNLGRVSEKGYSNGFTWSTAIQNVNNESYPSTPTTWSKKYDYDDASITPYAMGRLCEVQTNNGGSTSPVTETFIYDKYGNIVTKTTNVPDYSSAASYGTNYTYDNLGRVTQIVYPLQTTTTSAQNITVTSSSPYSASSATTLTVGPSFTVESGGTATVTAGQKIVLEPGFTASGGSTFRATIGPSVTYAYNQLGQVASVGNLGNASYYAAYSYNPDGTVKEENLNNSSSATNYSYDDRGFLTSISNAAFSESIAYTGGYNGDSYYNGSIASDSYSYPGAISGISNYTYTYSYDANNRMTNATNSANSSNSFTSIVYDNNGNVESRNDGSTPVSFTYSGSDIPIAYTDNGVVDDMTYDRDGKNLGNYYNNPGAISYDPFTLLTQGISERDIVTDNFEYDGNKQRVLNTYDNGGNQTTILYLHGTNPYPLEERTSSSTDYYVYGPTGLIAFINGGATYFVLKDHLGSTQVVLNSGNSPQSWYSYTPYGSTWQSTVSGNAGVAYEFTGQELELGGDLYNFRAREYDPALGIFYASDPADQTFSSYGYVGGNPVMRVDPTGRLWWLVALQVIQDVYEAYTAATAAYGTYQAIKSGDLGNIIDVGMQDAFSAAGLGFSASSSPGGFSAGDWAQQAGISGGLSVAGYYAGGGQGWQGGLESFGEGVGQGLLGMAIDYGDVSQWQYQIPSNPQELSLATPNFETPSALTLGTVTAESNQMIADTWDPITNQRIWGLDPRVQLPATDFINAAYGAGIPLRITQGYRSFSEQNRLYAQGRKIPGKIVTYARGGQSPHNFGLAIDVVEMKNGVPIWNNPLWNTIGRMGESFGFEWGGNWRFGDIDHFQMYWR